MLSPPNTVPDVVTTPFDSWSHERLLAPCQRAQQLRWLHCTDGKTKAQRSTRRRQAARAGGLWFRLELVIRSGKVGSWPALQPHDRGWGGRALGGTLLPGGVDAGQVPVGEEAGPRLNLLRDAECPSTPGEGAGESGLETAARLPLAPASESDLFLQKCVRGGRQAT